jgi:putative adhesin
MHLRTRSWILSPAIIAVAAVSIWAASAWGSREDFSVSEKQPPVERTFAVSGAPELVVYNITGAIHVVADSANEVRLTADETVRGGSQDDIARAKRDVHLDIAQDRGRVSACVNTPSRRQPDSRNGACRGGDGAFRHRDWGYSVRFDFELHVPPQTKVELQTVSGDVKIERLAGDFDVADVNGAVELVGMTGAGEAKTVNGDVKATFVANPRGDCDFSTVSGSLHTYFEPDFAAQLSYRTVNGDVYTDFPVATQGQVATGVDAQRRRRAGKSQIGAGGPDIQLRTVNGDIFVHRAS